MSIQYSPEKVALETAGGIANALDLLRERREPFLVVNGDTFLELDFTTVGQHIKSAALQANNHADSSGIKNARAHLVLVNNPPQHPNGDFAIDFINQNHGMLKHTGEKMLTFSGVGVYHPDLFADIVKGQAAKFAPLLRKAIDNNSATAQYYQGIWHDIGTPERLRDLDLKLQ